MHSSTACLMAKKRVTKWLIVQYKCLCVLVFRFFIEHEAGVSAKRSIYYNMQFVSKYGIFS